MNAAPTKQADPNALALEQFHGQMRLSIYNRMITLPAEIQAAPLLLTAGTVGELIGLVSNGDARLAKDCLRELQAAIERITRLPAEGRASRLESMRGQLRGLLAQHRKQSRILRHASHLPGLPPRR